MLKKIQRDENGLVAGINYVFNEDGSVNWRKMVRPEFLVPNREKTSETDVSKLEDKDLLILLGGLKELASLRGFISVKHCVTSSSPDHVVDVCEIIWLPNYETEEETVIFSAVGDASMRNTREFNGGKFFLGPIAENRAFSRCVRNFLKINIVAQDELSDVKQEIGGASPSPTPHALLAQIMEEKKVSFQSLKDKLTEENCPKVDTFESIADIPKFKVYELYERIKKL